MITAAIATPLEAELVASLRALDARVSVLYQPELLPPTRYPGDHGGVDGFRRVPEDESRWQEIAAVRSNPRLRWVQGTAAGTGEQLKAAGLNRNEVEDPAHLF